MDNWIGAVALGVSIIVGLGGYLSRPTFVPMARVKELEDLIRQLRDQLADSQKQVEQLTVRISMALGEAEFWRNEYRRLKELPDR